MAESENQKANQKVWTLPEGVGSKFFIAGEIDYNTLLDAYNNGSLTDVRGYILTDELHPLITSEVLAEMSKSGIQYQVIPYKKNGSQIVIW